MKTLYGEFRKALDAQDKEKALELCLKSLEAGKITVQDLYIQILTPALNDWKCDYNTDRLCIWNEHVRSSIVRTIIECCYPHIIRLRKEKTGDAIGPKVAVVCPPEEYHEIGARMVADFFSIAGYDVVFVGANTPQESFMEAIGVVKPMYVALSVSNYYNLINTRRIVNRLRERVKDLKIIVGGNAFNSNPGYWKEIGADMYLEDLREIFLMGERDLQ